MLSRRLLSLSARRRIAAALPARHLQPSAQLATGLLHLRHDSTYAADAGRAGPPSSIPLSMLQKSRSGSASTSKSTGSSAPPAATAVPTSSGSSQPTLSRQEKAELANHPSDSFHGLKGYVEYPLYKALVEKPFNFEKMSAVQEAVLGLLPELADPSARGAPKKEKSEEQSITTEDGKPRRGHREMSTDLLVKAKTGTGKTLAFLVPALEARAQDLEQEARNYRAANPDSDKHSLSRHIADYKKNSVGAIILSPTRELAAQIATEAVRATHHMKDYGVQLFIGGASKGTQMRQFSRQRRDIIVATPGRLADMLNEPALRPHLVKSKMLILDEADTLLDMGFKDAINDIVAQLPPKDQRQTFLFSATVSKEVRQIARNTIRPNHTFIDTVPANESNTHLHIPQYHTVLPSPADQIPHIFRLLAHDAYLHAKDGGKAIIFLPTTKMTELFATLVNTMRSSLPWGMKGTKVFELHSKKSQAARDRAADDFRNSKGPGYSILVTSDVSARGVDYPGVTRVIQVGIPPSKENYVHRLGRTGRAGKSGRGDIVLMPWEKRYVTSQLQDMPLQLFPTESLKEDLEKMAAEYDAKPTASSSGQVEVYDKFKRRPIRVQAPTIEVPSLTRIQSLDTKLQEMILPNISETEVHETFGSQLGFYVGHAHELGQSRMAVLEGLQQWATKAFNLDKAPQVSQQFLTKMGFGKERRGGGGGGGYGRNDRSGGGGYGRNDRAGSSRMTGYNASNGRARSMEDSWKMRRPGGRDGGSRSRY